MVTIWRRFSGKRAWIPVELAILWRGLTTQQAAFYDNVIYQRIYKGLVILKGYGGTGKSKSLARTIHGMTYLNFSVLVVTRHPIAWIPQIDTETVVTTFSDTYRQHPDLIEYVNISLCQPPMDTSRLNDAVEFLILTTHSEIYSGSWSFNYSQINSRESFISVEGIETELVGSMLRVRTQ